MRYHIQRIDEEPGGANILFHSLLHLRLRHDTPVRIDAVGLADEGHITCTRGSPKLRHTLPAPSRLQQKPRKAEFFTIENLITEALTIENPGMYGPYPR